MLEGTAVIHGVRPWLQSSAKLCGCFKRKLSSIQRESFTNFYSANIASSEKINQVMNADFPTSAVPFPHLQVATLLMNQQGANGLPLNLPGNNFQQTNEPPNPNWRDELTVQDRARLVAQL
jgi:hypothetical protein